MIKRFPWIVLAVYLACCAVVVLRAWIKWGPAWAWWFLANGCNILVVATVIWFGVKVLFFGGRIPLMGKRAPILTPITKRVPPRP
jgi:hypothetical protein